MKKLPILLLGFIMSAFALADAKNYFIPGTEWDILVTPPYGKEESYHTIDIRELPEAAGPGYVMVYDNKIDLACIRTIGNKVYFYPVDISIRNSMEDFDPGTYYLLYDFDMMQAECGEFYSLSLNKAYSSFVRCVSKMDLDPSFNFWPTMKYTSFQCPHDSETEKGTWILGIGDSRGPINFERYYNNIGKSQLVEVRHNGDVIYSKLPTRVSQLEEDNETNVSVSGLSLKIEGKDGEVVSVYSLDGSKIAETKGESCLQLPSAGVYIVKAGDISHKIVATP